ncbi:hypothetical protein [Allocoleopsis sp.]|uniref:hypothetical protein n=1 Tax=Allocoleopsis sp. TaxID=3088169 RepID=UPI002FD36C70
MPDDPKSVMIRVPAPLIDGVRELVRLHRQGRTQAVLEGVTKLIANIERGSDSETESVSEAISRLTERLDRIESEQDGEGTAVDIAEMSLAISHFTERLERVESDVNSIALTLQDLNVRLADLEGVGDIGYAVSSISALEYLDDSESITEESLAESRDINTDRQSIPELPTPQQLAVPLTQSGLAKRLGCSDKAIEKQRKQGDKENFAQWSRQRDPDGLAWSWEGIGGRGQPLRFVPVDYLG